MNKSNKKRENKNLKDSKTEESNPKQQRERRPKPVTTTNVPTTPNNDVDFSHLKKETDEIKKLTDSSKYSKREISSNWSRYEKRDDEEFTTAADFSSLLQAPVSSGGHFQFKSEKHWDVKIKSHFSEYFSLNLKVINDGILSIPFYDRHCIDPVLLNQNQIVHMNNNAIRYQNKLNTNEKKKSKQAQNSIETSIDEDITHDQINDDGGLMTSNDENESVDSISEITEKFVQKVDNHLLDVDDLLELQIEASKSISQEKSILPDEEKELSESKFLENNSKISMMDTMVDNNLAGITEQPKQMKNTTVDLEQWLDDILDD